jgi:flagellar basal-body rod protein FlgC
MDPGSIFDVSAAGMNLERLRLEVSAANLANANTTRGPDGTMYTPQQVVIRSTAPSFEALFQSFGGEGLASAIPVGEIQPADVAPRQVYDPSHPDADARGFVSYPGVNPVSEMVNLIDITRAYEANVRAFNAGRNMLLKALEIGSGR